MAKTTPLSLTELACQLIVRSMRGQVNGATTNHLANKCARLDGQVSPSLLLQAAALAAETTVSFVETVAEQ